ncbi:MAG TPA: HAMP domain-containing sensor histidine kinase [Acidimicrobiales bacterium]|nr:HAMP domain-containing sensor histidine kinase [Acidimicrobiales bacterium]
MTTAPRSRFRLPDQRWAHAARVALAATVVVGAVTLLLAVLVNSSILARLNHDIDRRLMAVLVATAAAPPGTSSAVAGRSSGDVDDAPVFVWRVTSDGTIEALTVAAPALPTRTWSAGTTTQPVEGRDFRLAAAPARGGWLVAGESVARVGESGGEIVLVEVVLGALLLLVTFTGSFVVGLRASAPIEQIRRRQAEFTADASHELRTPLSVIEAEVDLALGRPRSPDEYEDVLRRIGSESSRLRTIVEDLLWLARADGVGLDPGRRGTVDLSAMAEATVARFAAVADTGSIQLTARTAPAGTALIRADAEGIDRLVAVLVDNACKYAGEGGAVDVSVATGGGRVVLTVDDSGPGIPEAHRELVFDRFHRAVQSPGGTGLGLAIADAVVHATSGTWSIGSSPRGGARFEVTWRQAHRSDDLPPPGPGEAAAGPQPSDDRPGTGQPADRPAFSADS